MAQRLGARHVVIDGSIHSPAIENPPRTLEVLLDFWASPADSRPESRA
jgi:pimeloyl-ACP methyl ester carboxylesterase